VTVILYPNIFHDVPRSLEATMAFAVARRPSDYFAPLGLACELSGVASVVFGGRPKSMRYWVLASMFVLLVGEIFFSMVFFWPRNRVMFIEGPAVHSAAQLRQTAHEFQLGHWYRVVLSAVAAALSFIGFLTCYRDRISSRDQPTTDSLREVKDRSIAAGAKAALLANPATRDLQLTAICRDGQLSISGRVEREELRQVAGEVVGGIPGVTGVLNEIVVLPPRVISPGV
jgi:BON domain